MVLTTVTAFTTLLPEVECNCNSIHCLPAEVKCNYIHYLPAAVECLKNRRCQVPGKWDCWQPTCRGRMSELPKMSSLREMRLLTAYLPECNVWTTEDVKSQGNEVVDSLPAEVECNSIHYLPAAVECLKNRRCQVPGKWGCWQPSPLSECQPWLLIVIACLLWDACLILMEVYLLLTMNWKISI